MRRVLEWSLNLLCLCLIGIAVYAYLKDRNSGSSSASRPTSRIKIGQHLAISNVTWSHHRTLVLALSTTCHYCEESAPFYRELLKKQSNGAWQSIVLFPQSLDLGTSYVRAHDFSSPMILSSNYSLLGVSGTPTLVLVDETGTVVDIWIGRLSIQEEADVASHLGINPKDITDKSASPNDQTSLEVLDHELLGITSGNQKATVLDVRDRQQYSNGHLTGSMNIPFDELSTRAPHEIPRDRQVVLYCNFSPSCQADGLRSLCSSAGEALNEVGFKGIRYIRDNLSMLAQDNFSISKGLPHAGRSR